MPPKAVGKGAEDAADGGTKKGVATEARKRGRKSSKAPAGRGRSVSQVSGKSTTARSGPVTKKVKRAAKSKASVSKSGAGGSKKVKKAKAKKSKTSVAKSKSGVAKSGVRRAKDKPEVERVPLVMESEVDAQTALVPKKGVSTDVKKRGRKSKAPAGRSVSRVSGKSSTARSGPVTKKVKRAPKSKASVSKSGAGGSKKVKKAKVNKSKSSVAKSKSGVGKAGVRSAKDKPEIERVPLVMESETQSALVPKKVATDVRKRGRKSSKAPAGRGRSVSHVSGKSTTARSGPVTKKVKRAAKSKASVSKSGGGGGGTKKTKKVKKTKVNKSKSSVAKSKSGVGKAGVRGAKDKPEVERVPLVMESEVDTQSALVPKKGVATEKRKRGRKSKAPGGRGRSVSKVSGKSTTARSGSAHVTKKMKRAKPSRSRSEAQGGPSAKKVKRAAKSKASVSKSGAGGSKKAKRVKKAKTNKSKSSVDKSKSGIAKPGISGVAKVEPEVVQVPLVIKNEVETGTPFNLIASNIGEHYLRPRNLQNGSVVKKGVLYARGNPEKGA